MRVALWVPLTTVYESERGFVPEGAAGVPERTPALLSAMPAGSDPLKIHYNHMIVGDKPAEDAGYTSDSEFMKRVAGQYETIRGHENLPDDLAERYNQIPSASADRGSVECSLVNQVEGSFPGRSFGHILFIPDFGKVHLATLKIEHSDFCEGSPKLTMISLTMLRCEMGCIGGGMLNLGSGKTNGLSGP